MKLLDIGNSDFKSLMDNDNYYIDKSLLIQEIIEAQKQVILFPRPRRFGKTLNLSMIKYFFEINKPDNKKLFAGLAIQASEKIFSERQGKYPVIYLSFKDAKANNWIDTAKHIYAEIVNIYKQHLYLLKNNILNDFEQSEFNDILCKRADKVTYENSIKQICEYLYRYHNEKVVILIDEYDTPIHAGYKNFYEDVVSFMRNLLSGAFKDNNYLYKGVITGILRVSKESIFSGLNNISVYSILDEEFADKFGFTEQETKQILKDFNVSHDYEQVKKWYNGYKFGNTENIYNPWSILNFAVSKSGFKPFWVNTSTDELLKQELKKKDAASIREQLLKLTNNEHISKEIDENFVFPDLHTEKELLWTLLLFSGYLTTKNQTGRKIYDLIIPNFEIKTVFQDIIKKWLRDCNEIT